MPENIYISSVAFSGRNIEDIILTCKRNDWSLEFSSNISHRSDLIDVFLGASIGKISHNYFPAPKDSFVLNLASDSKLIREKSINHCKLGLELAKKSGAQFYSAHAGFCIDPDPEELGRRIKKKKFINRDMYLDKFEKSVRIILESAKKLDVEFLIENNVTSLANYSEFQINPFLCSEPNEINNFISTIQSPYLGLLLDTGHLKVTANTLNFDLYDAVLRVKDHVKCLHHSDNNATEDSNQPITKSYWFKPFMQQFKNLAHVIEVKNLSLKEISNQIQLLSDFY